MDYKSQRNFCVHNSFSSGLNSPTQRCSSERGFAIITASVLATALLFILGTIVLLGYRQLVKNELQTIADSAAHVGASIICSDTTCWDNALNSAARIIATQAAHATPGQDFNLAEAFGSSSAPEGGKDWNGTNAKVKIERGRWTPSNKFESLETWQTEHPGIVGYLTSNAVKVTITRPDVSPLISGVLGLHFNVSATSTAIAEAVKPVCAAPFAIPICSLVSQGGKLDHDRGDDRSTHRDRLFTSVNRHCGYQIATDTINQDYRCEAFPSFPIQPANNPNFEGHEGIQDRVDNKFFKEKAVEVTAIPNFYNSAKTAILPWRSDGVKMEIRLPELGENPKASSPSVTQIDKVLFLMDKIPRFNVDRYDSTHDNYGVFGIPGRSSPLEKKDIINILTGEGPGCSVDVTLGSPFAILPGGLTDKIDNDVMWNRISGAYESIPDRPAGTLSLEGHPPFYKSGLGAYIDNNAEGFPGANGVFHKDGSSGGWEPGNSLEFNSYWGHCEYNSTDKDYYQDGTWRNDGSAGWCPGRGQRVFDLTFDSNDNSGLCGSTRLSRALDKVSLVGGQVEKDAVKNLNKRTDDTNPMNFLDVHEWYANAPKENDDLFQYAPNPELAGWGEVKGDYQGIPYKNDGAVVLPRLLMEMLSTPVWITQVPIIARKDAQACQMTILDDNGNRVGPEKDMPIHPNDSDEDHNNYLNWEIVGFVKMAFYDTDIGNPPPSTDIDLGLNTHPYGLINGVTGRGSVDRTAAKSCNVVRGRILSSYDLIPRSNPDVPRRTVLVE